MTRLPLLALLVVCGAVGCKDKQQRTVDGSSMDGEPRPDRTPRPPRRAEVRELVPRVQMESFGEQPGYIAGGVLYTSMRVGELQRYWDSLPRPPEIVRDGHQAAEEIGFDPVSDNWPKHFHVADDAVVSATWLRPLDAGIDELRTALESGAPRGPGWNRAAAALGFHTRFVVPTADPAQTRAAFIAVFDDDDRERGTAACAVLPAEHCALSRSGEFASFRESRGMVTADFVFFALSTSSLTTMGLLTEDALGPVELPLQRARLIEALTVETATIPNTEDLAGDAAMWIDPSVLGRVAVVDKVESALRSAVRDGFHGAPENLERLTRLEALFEAPRLFPGVGVSFDYVDDDLHGVAQWPVAGALWGRMAVRSVTTKVASVGVPTTEALCEGSVVCFRSQALPDPRPVSKRLLVGGFAKPFEELVRALERDEEYTMTLLFAGAWPNLLAAGVNAPSSLRGPEAGIAATVRDAVMRSDGFGAVVRSFVWGRFGPAAMDYAVYARAAKPDIEAAKNLLSFVGGSVKDVELPGGKGRATALQLEDWPMSAHAIFQSDDEKYGWASVVSSPAELSWLLGRTQETPAGPMAYLEFPDLWRLVAPIGADDPDVRMFQPWLQSRRLQFVIELESGAPRLRAALTKR